MSESGEMQSFVTAVVFIILFGAFVATMPIELQGQGENASFLVPVDPSLVSDFSDVENWTRTSFSGVLTRYYFYNDLGGYDWVCDYYTTTKRFAVGALVRIFGIIWIGGISPCNFINDDGKNYGTTISFAQISNDAIDGIARYDLQFQDNGNSAGGFIFYWNTTTYTDPEDAWDNDDLNLIHGIGLENSAVVNIGILLLQLLFLQLPDTPALVNLIIASPMYAMILYILWFIFVKTTPFLG